MSSSPAGATPVTVDTVAASLRTSRNNGAYVLSGSIGPEVADLLGEIGESSLTITGPEFSPPSNGQLSVAGTTTLLGIPGVTAKATFTVTDGALAVALNAQLGGGSQLSFGDASWASVGDLAIDLGVTGPCFDIPVVSTMMSGTIRLHGVPDPITVQLSPEFGGDWRLRATQVQLGNPGDLLDGLAADAGGKGLMPPKLTGLAGFELAELACVFDPGAPALRSMAVTIGAPGHEWTFAPGLPHWPALSDVTLHVAVAFDGEMAVTAGAAATISLFGIHLPVEVVKEPDQWRIGIVGATGFPSLGEVVKTVSPGSEALLPSALATLQLESATFELTLGTDGAVQTILIGAQLADTWTLVADHLELDHVALQVLVDCASASTTGNFGGTIVLEGMSLPIAVQKPSPADPLTIALGTSAAPTLTGGVAALKGTTQALAADHLPHGFGTTALSLSDFRMAFDPATSAWSSLHLDVESDGPWSIPGLDGLDVRGLRLVVDARPGADVQGTLTGTLDLGGVALDMTITRGKGTSEWTVAGALHSPCRLGAMIAGLADKLGSCESPAALSDATLAGADFSFSSDGSFVIDGHGRLTVQSHALDLSLHLAVTGTSGAGFKVAASGHADVTVGGGRTEHFDLRFDKDPTSSWLSATWRGTPPLSIPALAETFKIDGLPDGLALTLEEIWLRIGGDGTIIFAADTAQTKTVLATLPAAGTVPRAYVGAFEVDLAQLRLSELPVVGSHLSSAEDIALTALQLVGSSELSDPQVKALGQQIQLLAGAAAANDPTVPTPATLPAGAHPAGVRLGATLLVGGRSVTVPIADTAAPTATPTPGASASPSLTAPATPAPPTAPAAPAAPGKWIDVGKSLGPVELRRVGVAWADGRAWLLLDGGLAAAGLTIDLQGLGLGFTLANPPVPAPALHGLAVGLEAGPVTIAGGLIEADPGEYLGELMINVEALEIVALGAWSTAGGEPSLFVFAMLNDPPLGGPGFFYVTGLAFGFGYNRSLVLPTLDALPAFPFIQAAMPAAAGNPFASADPTKALKTLATPPSYVPAAAGESWVAAGVRFTSFELLNSFALFTVEFGKGFEIALLGLTRLSIPSEVDEPIAYAELALEASYSSESGLVAVSGQLTPESYVMSKACKLTGGFAFYLWTKSGEGRPPAGEFVVTLGGYHPRFVPPHGYPQVPRIGANWQVSDELVVKAGVYFALTPSCVMAGGSLEAVWHNSWASVTFTAESDFLMGWKPFHYTADASITISGRLTIHFVTTITISFHLGAWLSLWGPPFAGRAVIDLDVARFTIEFGLPPAVKPTTWNEFTTSFLPQGDRCGTRIVGGLEQDLTHTGHPDVDWVVNGEQLVLETFTVVPSTQASIVKGRGNAAAVGASTGATPVAVGPVGLSADEFTSEHAVVVTREGAADEDDSARLTDERITANQPRALWAPAPPAAGAIDAANKPATVPDMLTGSRISAAAVAPPEPPPAVAAITLKSAADAGPRFAWARPQAAAATAPGATFTATVADRGVATERAAVISILAAAGADLPSSPGVAQLSGAEPVPVAIGARG